MRVLIESSEPAAEAIAALLAAEGHDVAVCPPDELDERAPPADVAVLDVWTPEVAPRVERLRAQGTRLTCLGDLLLERWQGPTIGVTGTAGKTSTTLLVAAALRAARVDLAVSEGARAGNLWPTGDLLERVVTGAVRSTLLLELTSSHLAFMCRSPRIAAVTCLWPDHIELHGSIARYRAAKETIVGHQRPGDIAVIDADTEAAALAAATPATVHEISLRRRVARGAWLREDGIVLEPAGVVLGHLEQHVAHPANAVAAAAVAAAAGAPPEAIAEGIASAPPPRWRVEPAGTLARVPVLDDGMAATPTKAAATLARLPARSVVLLAGGMDDGGGGPVHDTPEERALLERACDEIARAARVVVLFGDGGARLAGPLRRRQVPFVAVRGLADAVAAAAAHAEGAGTVLLSPLFPLTLEERAAFAGLVRDAAAA